MRTQVFCCEVVDEAGGLCFRDRDKGEGLQ